MTNPHISIIGHLIPEELRQEMAASDTTNGYANRLVYNGRASRNT